MNSPSKDQQIGLGSLRQSVLSPHKNKAIEMQKNQLRVILNDLKKVKSKCQNLYNDLGQEFAKKQAYDKLQKAISIKIEILNFPGIVEVKNQLIRALTELYDTEHELVYKKQRNKLRYNSPRTPKARKRAQFPPQIQKFTLEVPIYNTREQQNLLKIDRISSYLYDLRKNMRRLSTAIFKNYETTDFLMNEPEYLQVKYKLERYKMRNEELAHILQKKIKEQVQKFFNSCQCVQQTDDYKVLKVYDNDVKDMGRWYELTQTREWDDGMMAGGDYRNFKTKRRSKIDMSQIKSQKEIRSLRLIKSTQGKDQSELRKSRSKDPNDTSAKKNLNSSRISKRSSRTGSQIREQSEDKNNYVYMVHKFGPENEKNSSIISSLSSLRSKRKKVFSDDIWDEFDKI